MPLTIGNRHLARGGGAASAAGPAHGMPARRCVCPA
jgi:hypothetical protein